MIAQKFLLECKQHRIQSLHEYGRLFDQLHAVQDGQAHPRHIPYSGWAMGQIFAQ